jgi:hypothetical protein
VRLRLTDAGRARAPGRPDRLVPRQSRRLQGAAHHRILGIAEDEHGQNPEIQAARHGEGGVSLVLRFKFLQSFEIRARAMSRDYELEMLRKAAQHPKITETVKVYCDLLKMYADLSADGRRKFENLFSRYYGLRSAGLTDTWFRRYFDLLFGFTDAKHSEPYRYILFELYKIPRRQGDMTLQFSFVSKLIAFHDESRPLYDKHVRDFFGLGPPSLGAPEFRVSKFVDNLNEVAQRYEAWTRKKEFADVLDRFRDQHPELASRHPHRLFDFLVHTTGKHRIEV